MEHDRLIDLNLLTPFVGDNKAMQQQLLLAFEKELHSFNESMADAAINRNLEKVRMLFHRISPSLKMLHQQQLINLVEEYKQLLLEQTIDEAAATAQQQRIGAHANELLHEIKNLI